jgi:hypothetical protein
MDASGLPGGRELQPSTLLRGAQGATRGKALRYVDHLPTLNGLNDINFVLVGCLIISLIFNRLANARQSPDFMLRSVSTIGLTKIVGLTNFFRSLSDYMPSGGGRAVDCGTPGIGYRPPCLLACAGCPRVTSTDFPLK